MGFVSIPQLPLFTTLYVDGNKRWLWFVFTASGCETASDKGRIKSPYRHFCTEFKFWMEGRVFGGSKNLPLLVR